MQNILNFKSPAPRHFLLILWFFSFYVFAPQKKPQFSCLTSLKKVTNSLGIKFIEEQRDENAEAMQAYGYDGALKLIRKHAHLVAPGKTVLELGPFHNPLGPEFGKDIHWLVWEYDSPAAQKIAAEPLAPKRTVFHVDLNTLNKSGWKKFLTENDAELSAKKAQPELGAAVFSSVMNYVNYRVVLENVIPRMEDKGLLILANSEIAHGIPMNEHSRARPTIGMIEHLLSTYGNQIEILEGSEIDPNSALGPSKFSLALRIHKKTPPGRSDQYEEAVLKYLDQSTIEVHRGGDREIRNKLWPWLAKDRTDAENAVFEKQWHARRKEILQTFYKDRKDLIDRVKKAEAWDAPFSWDTIERAATSVKTLKHVLQEATKYQLMPERRILLKALDIADLAKREQVINEEIAKLYQSLGHSVIP